MFSGSLVSEGFFEILGAGATLGRTFLSQEYRPGSGVIVLTHGLWQRRFGGETDVIGRTLVLDGEPYAVIGVLAPSFDLAIERGSPERDFFMPKTFAEYELSRRATGWWHVIGRLRPEVTLAEAQAEMDAVATRLAAEYPRTNTDVGARVIPLQARQVEAVQPTLLLLQGAVLFVLLIACVNVANLIPLHAARAGVRRTDGGGRRARPPAAPTADRERRDHGAGRLRRPRVRDALARCDHRLHARGRAAPRPGHAERAAPRIRRRPGRHHDPSVRDGACHPGRPAERARAAPRAAQRCGQGAAAAAPRAGDGGSRAGAGAAGRRGSAPAELRAAGARRPRLRTREHGDAAGVPLPRRRARSQRELLPRDPRRHPRAAGRRRRRGDIRVPARTGRPHTRESAGASRPGAVSARRGAVRCRCRRDAGLPRGNGDPIAGRAVVRRA